MFSKFLKFNYKVLLYNKSIFIYIVYFLRI